MGKFIFWIIMTWISIIYIVTQHGVIEAVYVAVYTIVFILLANTLLFVYRKILLKLHPSKNIIGHVISTSVVKKSSVRASLGKHAASMSPILSIFNCIDVIAEDGKLYKIYESFNNEVEKEYDGKIKIGRLIEMTIRKCDSQYYFEEDLFRIFYGMNRVEKN